jgi:DNA-binding CsgD family transcriptional regulator
MPKLAPFERALNESVRPHFLAAQGTPPASSYGDDSGSAPLRFELSTLWLELCARRVRHVKTHFSERDCGALLEYTAGVAFGGPLPERDLQVLERTLRGEDQTAVAIDLQRSASGVSMSLRRTLHAMGFECTGCRLPLFLAVVARAATDSHQATRATTGLVERNGRMFRWVLLPRPDVELWPTLSRSEAAVARLLVEGKSHAEIAALRGTSRRTVANQLAASFHKLHISGRAQLLRRSVLQAKRAADAPPGAGA